MSLEPKKIILSSVEAKEIVKGFHGRFVHMNNMSIAFWEVDEGAEIPVHHHIHEQIMQVIEGEFELLLNDELIICKSGEIVVIPSNIKHGGKAITKCKITDVFSPVREEYK